MLKFGAPQANSVCTISIHTTTAPGMPLKNTARWKATSAALRRRKRRNQAAIADIARRRLRLTQHNENILITKYRAVLRQEESDRERLRAFCKEEVEKNAAIERSRRCSTLRTKNSNDIKVMLRYLDKVECFVKEYLDRWLPQWTLDVDAKLEKMKADYIMRFRTYISQLRLSGFNLNDLFIEDKCGITEYDNFMAEFHNQANMQIDELKKKVIALQVDIDEEKIREAACIKVRESDVDSLRNEIEMLSSQIRSFNLTPYHLNE